MTISFLTDDRVEFHGRYGTRRLVVDRGRRWNVYNGDVGSVTRSGFIRIQGRRVSIRWVKFDRHDAEYPRPFQWDDLYVKETVKASVAAPF